MSIAQADPTSHLHTAAADSDEEFGGWRESSRRGRGLPLRTLIILRWLAIAGQSATVLVASTALGFEMPVWQCALVIAASVAMNLLAMTRLTRSDGRLPDGRQTVRTWGSTSCSWRCCWP